MSDRAVVAAAGSLLEALAAALPQWSRNTLRQRLRLGCIEVDGEVARRHDQPVAAGAVVTIRPETAGCRPDAPPGLPILLLDDDLCAIDKPAGLLSVGSDDERARTALALLRAQLGGGELWPAHRIDRETSGVLLFARTRAARESVQAGWERTHKLYEAVVEGAPPQPEGEVDQPLWEDRNLFVRVGARPEAKPARTRYRTLARGAGRTHLAVELDTGRKHQIRAHLAWLGCPIVGDARYGARGPRLLLHAVELAFEHPRDGRRVVVRAPAPAVFAQAVRPGR
ncbi:MAG: RluA family pseudouridine synthase [Planctomycetes bacterium]|nr:RluA family pseudouridine synthase [Planctomycetota bacterium]